MDIMSLFSLKSSSTSDLPTMCAQGPLGSAAWNSTAAVAAALYRQPNKVSIDRQPIQQDKQRVLVDLIQTALWHHVLCAGPQWVIQLFVVAVLGS